MRFGLFSVMILATALSAQSQSTRAQSVEGDTERGRLVFGSCRTCHYPEKGVGHHNGPSLWNIFGREVGSQPDFDYSPALREADFVWTPELLDLWLENPRDFLSGNTMMIAPMRDPQRRADLIEYLKQFAPPEQERQDLTPEPE